MTTWFDKLSVDAQNDYCAKLKGGKKKSKFCNLDTGRPLPVTDRAPSKPKKVAPTKTAPESSATPESPAHEYYDVKGDHSWAKKAEIKNLGEDIKGSARHKKNAHRDWGDLNAMSENKEFTKKELLKIDAITSEATPEGHEIPFWVIKDILSKFPDEKGFTSEDKKLWIEKYQIYLAEGKKIATENRDPIITAELFTSYLKNDLSSITTAPMGSSRAFWALKHFCRNARRDTFYKATGAVSKLKDLVPREKFKSNDPEFAIVMAHLEEIGVSKKIKDVIDGKPFLSTITGQKNLVDRFDEASIYKEIIMAREGDNVFDTAEESGEFLSQKVGFKGIQFGNSLPDNERADHLGKASHAFHDMSEALGISPEDISMNGQISLGFGSRGVGGSLATYHPDHKFINLTRHNGYGALAHEWGHAYGFNVCEKVLAKTKPGTTQKLCISELDPKWVKGTEYESILTKINEVRTKTHKRFRASDEYKGLSNSRKKWLWASAEIFARAFETYTAKKMESKGKKNTYLVSDIKSFGWPNDEEMKDYEEIFDSLLSIKDSFKA